jgi:isopentenyl diphosphate isomerase/L-lactate dehydrogenase-like FMN-dependent dehydrogenase
MIDPSASRRRFLHYLAASPLFAGAPALAQSPMVQPRLPDPLVWAPRDVAELIDSPSRALSVFDFEPVARQKLSAAHFGYMATGNDDEVTLRVNREGFAAFQLRPRRLVDVSRIDMKMELFGTTYDSPIVVAPTGSNKAFHADGEIAVVKAARAGRHLQMLSTVATTSIEDAIAARGGPLWFQLYPTNEWSLGLAMAKRAEKAGAPAIVVTVDVVAAQNWEMFQRMWRADKATAAQCGSCHGLGLRSFVQRKPNFDGLDLGTATNTGATNLTWDFVKRLRDSVGTKILLKGILAREDAKLAVEHGVDGIIVSNHGGRAEDNGRSTIEVLPEILVAVDGRIPVLVDSGFRRGTDIVKALAMGAKAVCVGRPYLWGLGAFGQEGVERVLQLLRRELFAAMQQMGAPSLKDLVPAMVTRA